MKRKHYIIAAVVLIIAVVMWWQWDNIVKAVKGSAPGGTKIQSPPNPIAYRPQLQEANVSQQEMTQVQANTSGLTGATSKKKRKNMIGLSAKVA